ncbi:AI-2E family transporter [Robbsia sp. Bb-Pol-6]|uniref:AI-2E family transporter n=1 Tax=Robbsia betulipollinis TaxID=2981849 RepID=A0ABT3ZGT2_9BURK|nr:AI-2E family transporter [Robbsia betulipollinis]MCY0385734.1 AI-2E family transporter [Robbsia betulipollinis]
MSSSPPPRARAAAKVLPADAPTTRGLTSVITGVVIVCALYFGRDVLIPIILAVLLSFLVAPFVGLLRRLHFGQVPSVIVAVFATLGVIVSIGVLIGLQVVQLSGDLPHYQRAVERKIQNLERHTVGRANAILNKASNDLKRISPAPTHDADGRSRLASSGDGRVQVEVHEPPPSPIGLAQQLLSLVIGPVETTGIVLVVAIFILLQREDLRDRLIRLLGSRDLHRTTTAMDEAARRLSRYFLAQLSINIGVGLVISIGLMVIGVPGAILFGVLTALLRFVPYIGTWIAALVAVVFAAAVGPSWSMLIWTMVLFGATDLIAGQIVEPLAYGRSTGLSPFAVIVAAIFWSWIWGPIGLVLSTPLTLCLVILGRHVERLEFLDVLFGDRPALTPAENFYQRLLVNDPDELLAQAESLLKARSLSTYYDEVALAGLRLAYNDLLRGVVTAEQIRRITESAHDIVEGLEETADLLKRPTKNETPPASTGLSEEDEDVRHSPPPNHFDAKQEGHTTAVLCIAGRGELDALAGMIAVQLLRKHGLIADLAPYARFSRTNFTDIDLDGVPIICIVSFDATESPSYLRNLQRRLRLRAPQAEQIVGITDPQNLLDPDGFLRETTSATSFKQVVDLCVAAARRQTGDSVAWEGLTNGREAAPALAPALTAPGPVIGGNLQNA